MKPDKKWRSEYWLLLTLIALCSGRASAFDSIEFFSDYTEERVRVAAKACTALLDDESNYSIATLDDHTFLIKAKAENTRSALLIIDCDAGSFPYSLTYNNRQRFNSEEKKYQEIVDRPNSWLGADYNFEGTGGRNGSFEIVDRSYFPVGASARRSYSDLGNLSYRSDSFDLSHYWSDYNLSYGTTKGTNASGDDTIYRGQLGILGFNLNAQNQYKTGFAPDSRYYLSTPSPANIRLSFHKDKDNVIERGIERNFYSSMGKTSIISLASISNKTFADEQPGTQAGELSEDINYGGLPMIKPGTDLSAKCRSSEHCRANRLRPKAELRSSRITIDAAYGILPHDVSSGVRFNFAGQQELRVSASRQFSPYSWTENTYWADVGASESPLNSAAQLHLEYRNEFTTYTAEHDIPIQNEDGDRSIFARFAIQRETPKVSWGSNLSFPYKDIHVLGFGCFVRYYFTTNIQTISMHFGPHSIGGKVTSSSTKEPLSNVDVELLQSSKTLQSTRSDPEGRFIFRNVPAIGEFELLAKSRNISSRRSVSKELSRPEVEAAIELDDRVRLEIKFVNSEPKSIINHIKETGDAIVSFPDAMYSENTIWVRRQGKIKLKFSEELLPYGYKVLSIQGLEVDSNSKEEQTIEIRLEKVQK